MSVSTFKGGLNVREDSKTVTDATVSITKDLHSGRVVKLDRAAGVTATLPASTGKGDKYRFYVATTVTSNADIIQVANSSDTMVGQITMGNTTGGNGWQEAAGGTDDTITMNGTTTGGIAGSYIEVEDIAENVWRVSGHVIGSGTLAALFSAAV